MLLKSKLHLIINAIYSKTGSNIAWVLSGNFILQLISFFISIIFAHVFHKDIFANFIIILTCMEILRFFSQFGLRMATVKYASTEELHNRSIYPVLVAYIVIKLIIAVVVLTVVIMYAHYISGVWLKDVTLSPLLQIASFNIIGLSLLEMVLIYLNVKEYFREIAKCNTLQAVVRLTVVLLALIIFSADLRAILVAWVMAPLLVCTNYWKIFYNAIENRGIWRSWIPSLLSFSKWIFLAILLTIACNRMDFYLLNWNGEKGQIADYGVAITFASMIKLLAGSSATVLLPKACKVIFNSIEFKNHLKTISKVVVLGVFLTIFFAIFGKLIIRLIYGRSYLGAYIPAVILCVAYLLFLSQELISQIYIALKLPWLKTILNAFQLIVLLIIGNWLIPKYFVCGAAISVLAMYFLGVIFSLLLCRWLYGRMSYNIVCNWRIN